jgi:hypothetical protein
MSQRSRKQRERDSDSEFAENDVPRRERDHSAAAVLPPMNPARHFLVEWARAERNFQETDGIVGFAARVGLIWGLTTGL